MNSSSHTGVNLARLLRKSEPLALVLLITLFILKGLIPAWESLRSDFPNYYVVARLLREHYPLDRIYDWIWLQRVKDHWSVPQSLIGFVGLTPFSALPVLPLTWLDALEAKRVWLVLNLALLAASIYGMQRITSLGTLRVALIAFLAIIPLRNSFLLGQMHLLVLALLVLAYWLCVRKNWAGCSLALAIAASLKIYPVFFVFYFLRKREWKPALLLAGATAVVFAACFIVFGTPVMRVFLFEQFPRMMRGEATDPFSLTIPSASSLFHRIFLAQPQVNPNPLIPSPLLYALFYPLWQLGLVVVTILAIPPNGNDSRVRSLEWACWICLLLTLSTEPATYHKVALILVAVLAMHGIDSMWRKTILLAFYFLACNAHASVAPQYPALALLADFIPYWSLVALLAFLLVSLRARRVKSLSPSAARPGWPRTGVAWRLVGFTAVWAIASATTYAHARTMNNPSYLADRSSSAFAQFAPHVAGAHLLTVAMRLEGYRVEDEHGKQYQTATIGPEDDQLAIASAADSSLVWIEAVSGGRSRLVEVPVQLTAAFSEPIATIFDAESPGLSPDGRSLVFIRETKGEGTAWLARLDGNGELVAAPKPISPAEMDVQDVAFTARGDVLMSASDHGVPQLFVQLAGTSLLRVSANADDTEIPAAQTKNTSVVFTQEKKGFRQLFVSDPSREPASQLTFGDCNAYDPAWVDATRLVYISDCSRGMGMGAVAEINLATAKSEPMKATAESAPVRGPQGDSHK